MLQTNYFQWNKDFFVLNTIQYFQFWNKYSIYSQIFEQIQIHMGICNEYLWNNFLILGVVKIIQIRLLRVKWVTIMT